MILCCFFFFTELYGRPIASKSLFFLNQKSETPVSLQDPLKNNCSLALVSDSKSKHIQIPLTNHISGDQGSHSEGKASNHTLLQVCWSNNVNHTVTKHHDSTADLMSMLLEHQAVSLFLIKGFAKMFISFDHFNFTIRQGSTC